MAPPGRYSLEHEKCVRQSSVGRTSNEFAMSSVRAAEPFGLGELLIEPQPPFSIVRLGGGGYCAGRARYININILETGHRHWRQRQAAAEKNQIAIRPEIRTVDETPFISADSDEPAGAQHFATTHFRRQVGARSEQNRINNDYDDE